MASKKQIMDKLSALNPAVPTRTRVHGVAASAAVPQVPQVPESAAEATATAPIVVEAKQGEAVVVAGITPPVFSNTGVCTFTLFIDNMAAMMKIREEFHNNFFNINSMIVDSYKKTLTITFDAMRHNYSQFVESLKFMMPTATQKRN
ncbi:hypothetical protein [Candidatus Magnetominusculus dajiuhuensis]|uniref:hypothetical protein n=1 Tax=Candidatus Magnetominusculus dajiuhuensis TaxID=3137712 RepID=UPI003B43D1D5